MSSQLEGHTVQRYDGELNNLHLRVVKMGGLAVDQLKLALRALQEKDLQAAETVIQREHEIDEMEIATDDEIITVIAKRSPVARDLRVVMSISKAITDLERVGDEAARVAHLAHDIYGSERSVPSQQLLRDVATMGRVALDMLEEAVHSFDRLDLERARRIAANHGELDQEFQSCLRRLATFLLEDARNVGHTIQAVLAVKALERIGDHARNIAEYVVYLVSGEDIRHQAAVKHPKGNLKG